MQPRWRLGSSETYSPTPPHIQHPTIPSLTARAPHTFFYCDIPGIVLGIEVRGVDKHVTFLTVLQNTVNTEPEPTHQRVPENCPEVNSTHRNLLNGPSAPEAL